MDYMYPFSKCVTFPRKCHAFWARGERDRIKTADGLCIKVADGLCIKVADGLCVSGASDGTDGGG